MDDFEIVGDEAAEARIVAVVLDEASDFEREEVDRLCEENPELQVFRRRIEAVHGLIGESRVQNPESRPNTWKLSKERRAEVLTKLGEKETVVAGPERTARFLGLSPWQHAALIAVACVVIGLLVPTRMKALARSNSVDFARYESAQSSPAKPARPSVARYDDGVRALRTERTMTEKAPPPADVSLAEVEPESSSATLGLELKPSVPSSSMAKVIASSMASPSAVPVPEVAAPAAAGEFGDGDDFGIGGGAGRVEEEAGAVASIESDGLDAGLFPALEENPKLRGLSLDAFADPGESLAKVDEDIDPFASDEGLEMGRGFDLAENESKVLTDSFEYRANSVREEEVEIGKLATAQKELSELEANHPNNFDHFSAPSEEEIAAYDERVEVARAQVAQVEQNYGEELRFGRDEGSTRVLPKLSETPLSLNFFSGGEMSDSLPGSSKNEKEPLITRRFSVPSTFRSDLGNESSNGLDVDPFASGEGLGGRGLVARKTVKSLLEDSGVNFGEGASARYIASTGELIVTNTESNFGLLEQVTESLGEGAPGQVEVETKTADTESNDVEVGGGGGPSLLGTERIRREAGTQQAVDLLMEGRKAYADKDYEEATRFYKESLNTLPFGPKTEAKRNEIAAHLADGSVALAQEYRRSGRYDEAKELLNDSLSTEADSFAAKKSLEYFDDPIRTNPSATSEHSENVDEIRRLLYKGEGHYNLADYDQSEKTFQEVLKLDPYNKAARRWLERNASIKSHYYRAAYDQTRAKLLMETDKAWELTVPTAGAVAEMEQEKEPSLMDNLFEERDEDLSISSEREFQYPTEYEPAQLSTRRSPEEAIAQSRKNSRVATLEEQIVAKEQSIAAIQSAGQKQEDIVELATEMHDYKEATREYESSLALLQELKLKHSSERVGLRSPREPVTIQEEPKVPKKRGGFLGLGKYESEAAVQVSPGAQSFGSHLGVSESKQYFETQKEVATATQTLSSVVDSLELDKKWGSSKEEAIKKLKSSVKVAQRPGTDTLEIKGVSKDPELAREIAAEVASAYQKRRNTEEAQRAEAQLGALDAEIEKQKDKVEAKRKVLDTIVRITGRPYFEGSATSVQSTETQLKMIAERNAFDMKKNRDQYEIYLDRLETLESEQLLRYAAELPVDNNSVRELKPELLSAQRELEALKARGLGERHPSMVVQKERVEGLQKDVESAVANLKESLSSNYEMISEQLAVLDEQNLSPDQRAEKIREEQAELSALKEKLREKQALEAAKALEALGEKDAATEGDSTFSLHVSDVSFKLAKAALEQGKWPETVRVEEFVNAFSYGERSLAPNVRVGVAMEQAAHPFLSQRNLLRVSLQTAATGRGAGVPLRLTVVLDKSGSMERLDRAAAVDEAFRVLVEQLNPGDKVTLVGFSRTPSLLADFVDGAEGERLLKILRETPSEGGTNVEEALKLARAKALEHFEEGAQNRVILLTDGIANLGESVPEQLMTLVEGMREEEVAFDACGVGVEGLNDDILEALTRKGDGRYYLLGSTEESGADFAKQVAGALRPAAQNVKVQIEWNPERVGKWRLYGFEKHELKKEDFRNDSVDAAEMAAEEEGVALYHVEVKPDGEGPLGVARVRFLDVANDEMVEREWEIAYEGEAAALSEADAKVRLAGVAGLVAEKLARSAIGERAEWDELLEMTRQLQSVFPKEERVKDLERMIEQAKGLE